MKSLVGFFGQQYLRVGLGIGCLVALVLVGCESNFKEVQKLITPNLHPQAKPMISTLNTPILVALLLF